MRSSAPAPVAELPEENFTVKDFLDKVTFPGKKATIVAKAVAYLETQVFTVSLQQNC